MHFFLVARYSFFALFTALNVLIATTAAWNTQLAGVPVAIDSYLVAIAILGIVFVFPVMFIELIRKGAFTSRIWFEVAWTALFWVLHLAGAAATSASQPLKVCSPQRLHSLQGACTSVRVLLAFTWCSSFTLLAYLVALFIVTVMHMTDVPRVWSASVRDVDWFAGAPRKLPSPVLPIYNQFATKPPTLYTVSAQPATLAPPVGEKPAEPAPPRTVTAALKMTDDAPPLYPHYMAPVGLNQPPVQVGPQILPAGQWPRRQPTQSAPATAAPPSASQAASAAPGAVPPSAPNARTGLKPLVLQTNAGAPPRTAQSAGARTKPRPPPLNLSGISAFDRSSKSKRLARAPRR